jgi:hypothetical protein
VYLSPQRYLPASLLVIYVISLAIIPATIQRTSPHWTSRLATVESLVVRGTFAIDGSTYAGTVDRVKIGDRFYSHQPPAHAVLTALVYLPLYWLGFRFSPEPNAAYAILTFIMNGLSTAGALILFFRALEWFRLSDTRRLLLTAGVACGTLVLPYSTTFNVHGFVAALLFAGFYCFMRAADSPTRHWSLYAGLAFSMCVAMDHGTAFLYAAFCLLLVLRPERRRQVLWFVLPAFFTILPTAVYYYSIGGSLTPFAARPELFRYPGSPWIEKSNNPFREQLTGGSWNSARFALQYGFLCLFGPRGFLIYNPLLWIALYGLGLTILRRLAFWREAVAVAAGSVAMMLYYFFASTNYSGWSYSIRWFVALIFLWAFFGAAAVQRMPWRTAVAIPITALAAVSVFYAVGGVADPWPRPNLMGYLTPLFNINRMREPYRGIRLTVASNAMPGQVAGDWPITLTVTETGGVPVTLTKLIIGGVDRSGNIMAAFGGNHLPANAATSTHLNLRGYSTPANVAFEVNGEEDNGRPVKAAATIELK